MSDVMAAIEGNLVTHPLDEKRLRFDVALHNKATEPRYVTAIRLLRDGVEVCEVAARTELDADEIADRTGIGVFDSGVSAFSDNAAARISTAVLMHSRRLKLPLFLTARETVRGPCVAHVGDTELDGDWTVSAVVREEASEQTDTPDAQD